MVQIRSVTPVTKEPEAGELEIRGWPWIQSAFKAGPGNLLRLCLKQYKERVRYTAQSESSCLEATSKWQSTCLSCSRPLTPKKSATKICRIWSCAGLTLFESNTSLVCEVGLLSPQGLCTDSAWGTPSPPDTYVCLRLKHTRRRLRDSLFQVAPLALPD